MFYVAVPVKVDGETIALVRMAKDTQSVYAQA